MLESIRAGPSIFAALQNSDFARLHTLEFRLAGPVLGNYHIVFPNLTSLSLVTSLRRLCQTADQSLDDDVRQGAQL